MIPGYFYVDVPSGWVVEPAMDDILASIRRSLAGLEPQTTQDPLSLLHRDIADWLRANCKHEWKAQSVLQIGFTDKDDAMLFKLTWGGE